MRFERWFCCTEYQKSTGCRRWGIVDVTDDISYHPVSKTGDKYIRSMLLPMCAFTPNFLIPFFIKFKINNGFKACRSYTYITVDEMVKKEK